MAVSRRTILQLAMAPALLAPARTNNDVLDMVGESSVWSIQTKVHGFRHPSGMN